MDKNYDVFFNIEIQPDSGFQRRKCVFFSGNTCKVENLL